MELKWYENVNAGTGKRFWWTQRDKLGNCFEIYGKEVRAFRKRSCELRIWSID